MRRWILVLVLLLFAATPAYGRTASQKKARPQTPASQTQAKETGDQEEPYKAYVVMEASSGKILEGPNTHLRCPPPSITKFMVPLLVMEKLAANEIKLTDTITASRDASKMGGSQVFLKEGESFTLEELMKAMLIASANDAAYAIAEHIAGSKDKCVDLMNEKARALNMNDTEFRSVHGLPPAKGEEEDITSPEDLGILARHLLKYRKLLEWTSAKSEPFRDSTLIMVNHNKLLGRVSSIDGLKTGFYRKCGYNIVATARKGDLRLIVVVMGSPAAKVRDDVVEEKVKKYLPLYEMVPVIKKGDTIDREIILTEATQRKLKGVTAEGFSYPMLIKKKSAIKKEVNLPEKLGGEIKQDQKLGELVVKLDDEVIGKVDIVSPAAIPKAGFFTRLFRKFG
ncbi:MAG: D-alanyl-D-alanine carboxypeptidase family protein, partial [Deltaproteobacteria bacterium]